MCWNWESVIEKNKGDLTKIIASLFVLASWVPGQEKPSFLRRAARSELARLLRVTEAALRRLIVIIATVRKYDGTSTKPSATPLPDFSTFGKGSKSRKPVFNLVDPRKRIRFLDETEWNWERPHHSDPRIWTLDSLPRMKADAVNVQKSEHDGELPDPKNLLHRLEALDHALKSLPRQARRMARLIERRKSAPPGPACVPPIKIGPPPGYLKHPVHEADHVLKECHGLVRDLKSGLP